MKKYILGTILSLGLLVSPAFVPQAEAASLTPVQVSAIISLLQVLGIDQSVIDTIQTALGGGSPTGSSLTVPATHKLPPTGITAYSDATSNSANASVAGDTGEFPRQDARYARSFDYTKQGAWGVLDNITGLTWEVAPSLTLYTWADTASYVSSVNAAKLGGYSDWRMPTVKELEGLVDYGIHPIANTPVIPTIDSTHFPDTAIDLPYWTSEFDSGTAVSGRAVYGWAIDFADGSVVHGYPATTATHTRLVRGTANPARFVSTSNGTTVTDNSTGLMWKRDYEMRDPAHPGDYLNRFDTFLWSDALKRAVADKTGGYSDWRVPNVRELLSLVDRTVDHSSMNSSFFPTTPIGAYFWTSSPTFDYRWNVMMWNVGFDFGQDGIVVPYQTGYVRLVRDVTIPPASGTAPTARITINGQPSVTNADPLVERTWAWSGTPGATYSASGNITGCENTSQNGPQPDWKPWIGGTGTASSGSTSATPGAVKYGCTIVGTYNVTKDGQTTTGIATITYKHANGSVTTLPPQGSVTKASFAVNEYVVPGQPPANQYTLGFWGGTDLTCSLVSGPLPPGVSVVSLGKIATTGHTGCALVGVASQVGVYNITWKGTGKEYMSDIVSSQSGDLEITVYEPKETYRISPQDALPSATVGIPYYFKFRVITTGNPDITGARFGERGSVLYSLGLKIDDITGEITGTPTTAGTYKINELDYGVSTYDHMSGSISPQLVVKPRNQTLAQLNASIMTAWTDQPATSFKTTMVQSGWTLGDVTTATGLKMSDIADILYPNPSGDLRSDQHIAKLWAISTEAAKIIDTFDWSEANKHQSALSFRTIMIQKGITLEGALYGYYTLGGWGVARNEIKAVVDATSNPVTSSNLVASVSNSASGPFTANGTAVYNNLPVYARITSAGVNMKSYSPQGCIQPVGTSGCSSNLGYRDYLPSEWLDNSTIQTVVQDPSIYPLTTYELYIKFPGGSPIKAGSFVLQSGVNLTKANNVSVPNLTTLSPSSSTVETTIIINGSGFTGTNNIYMDNILIDPATVSSSGGLTPTWISFVVPSKLPSCPGSDRFCTPGPALTRGTHSVFVQNTNGTSNTVSLGVN